MSSAQEVGDIFGAGRGPAQAMLRAPSVLIVAIGLWGMNLFFFKLFRIDYKFVLNYDLREMEGSGSDTDSQSTTGSSCGPPTIKNKSKMDDVSLCLDDASSDHVEDGKGTILMGSHTHGSTPTSDTSAGTTVSTATNTSVASVAASFMDGNPQDNYGLSITWFKLVIFSIVLLCLLHFTTHFWMDHLGRGSIGAVFSFYGAVIAYIFLPLQSNRWLRRAFVLVLQRCFELVNPRCSCLFLPAPGIPRKIPFIDVFFADALCSLSKVFFDWGMLLHQAVYYPDPVPMSYVHILLPSFFAAIPFIIRARQCLIMHTVGRLQNDPKRYQHMLNAIKYSTSIFPLCLSAYQKTLNDPARAAGLEKYLIFLLAINALYGLYWDIAMDWGMMQNPTVVMQTTCLGTSGGGNVLKTIKRSGSFPSSRQLHHGCLRPRLRFGLILSTLIVVADSLLRFSWTLRFVTQFPSNDAYVLCTQFLEIFRRAVWNLLRVEWENIKQKKHASTQQPQQPKIKARDSLSDHDPDDNNTDDEDDLEFTTLIQAGPGVSVIPDVGVAIDRGSSSVVIVGTPASVGDHKKHGRKNSIGNAGVNTGGGSLKK